MYHLYRSCRTFPCGFRRYAYASDAYASDTYASGAGHADSKARAQRWQSSRHRHSHRGGSFGARRPLRYLSYRLDLDEQQQRTLAAILERLKLDREQAKLDEQKTVSAMADLVTAESVSVDGSCANAPARSLCGNEPRNCPVILYSLIFTSSAVQID